MKKTFILFLLLFLLIPFVAFAQSRKTNADANQSWQKFFSTFSAAVKKRDGKALKTMMSSTVRYENELEGTPEDLIQSLDADKGDGWRVLQGAIASGAKLYKPVELMSGKKFYAAKNSMPCARAPCGYSALAVFALGKDDKWRLISFLYIEN